MITFITVAFIVILVIVCIVAAARSIVSFTRKSQPKKKGSQGENTVVYTIKHTQQGKYHLINDIIICDKNGMTHQIDHIVINKCGVFIIETKNYSGKIYGRETQNEWTQVLAYGNTVNKLKNPVKQNKSHIYCLKSILPEVYFRPLVVFVQNNTQHIEAQTVIPLNRLKYELTRYEGQILTDMQIDEYYERIIAAESDISTEQHVDNILRQQEAIKKGICPRCGSKLVVRQRRDGSGSFYGCSSFPDCRFTKNID